MAPPGADRPGQDLRPRVSPPRVTTRDNPGRRGHQGHPPSPAAAGPYPVLQAALPPGRDRHLRDRENDPAAAPVGRVHGHGPATARGRDRAASVAGGPRLQRRRGLAADRRADPPGPARRGRAGHGDLAGRGEPVAVGAAAGAAHHHADRHDRARDRRRRLLRRRDGGGRDAGRAGAGRADFLGRLDASWLTMAYASAERADEAVLLRSAGRHVGDIALRFRTLFRRLGSGLDGPGTFADADVWYCILEGTSEIAVAEAQARALVDMLASYAVSGSGAAAEILLAVDEFSAVSRRLPIWHLYERARSLGLAVQVSAQSWAGLAAHEDERYRVAATADGGIWLLRTPQPEPATALAGSRPVVDTTRRLLGAALFSPAPSGPAPSGSAPFGPALFGPTLWSHEGQSRQHRTPVVDADLIRRLAVGQAAYIYRGGVTFVQVKRLVAAPAELPMPVRPAAGEASRPVAAGVPGSPGRPELDR